MSLGMESCGGCDERLSVAKGALDRLRLAAKSADGVIHAAFTTRQQPAWTPAGPDLLTDMRNMRFAGGTG